MTDTVTRIAAPLADRYRVEREIGRGGMATVFLAEDIKHHRRVAIKVLHPELSAVLGPDRFLTEIALTARLQHPHILPLFDSGSADGLLYYVMPYIEGETLRGRLERERQLPIGDAIRIASEVADALEYAHQLGVIHRDIKPENILLQGGHCLVADFGIALAVATAGGSRMTQTGLSLGTPQYMAPEQATGEAHITCRADIYALGAVTYEMLAGEPPFTGPNAQAIVARMLTEEPRRLIPQRRSVPPGLEDAVLIALEKLPADRFATAAEFAKAVAGESTRHRTGGTHTHARRPLARAYGSTALVVGALGLAAFAFVAGTRTTGSRSPIVGFGRSSKVTWDPGLEIEPALSPDGRYVAYAAGTTASMRIFVRQVSGGRPTRVTDDSLDVQTNPSWSADGSRILFLSNGGVFSAPSSGGSARPEMQPVSQGPIISAVWAPDGRTIAYAVQDSVYLRNPAGKIRSLARIADASLCQWSPSGELIACVSNNSLYSRVGLYFGNLSPSRVVVAHVRDGAATTVTDSISTNQSPVWSPDGKWLYFVSSRLGPRDIYAVRISRDGRADGVPRRLTTGLGAHCISISASGRRFAYDVYTATSNVWSLPFPPHGATQTAATPITSGTQVIEGVASSPDGKWLFFDSDVSGNAQIYRQRLPIGDPEQLTFGLSDDFAPAPSPDGREIAFHSWRSGSRNLYTLPLDGGPVQPVTASPLQWALPNWSPDGHALTFVTFGDRGGIWVVRQAPHGAWGKPVQRSAAGTSAIWSPDGRWIAYSSNFFGGSLMIVNPDSGAPRVVLNSAKSAGVYAEEAIWSSDSRTLYFNSHDPKGNAAFWAIPVTGGQPRLLTRFDDPTRPSYRGEWSIGSGRMYYTINDRQSDVWVMEATPR
jgi:serine/threonine-protein kinase